MNKQNLWFITLFSLILVLSVYYVTMPNDLLLSVNGNYETSEKDEVVSVVVKDSEIIQALRITKEEDRLALEKDYQQVLTNAESTSEQKNEALEKIKSLKENATLEDSLEEKIKKNYKLDCCVQINNDTITSTCSKTEHNNSLANNIMRSIQEEFDTNKYITIKFES